MDINRPELHASGFRAILEVARNELGSEVVNEMLAGFGTSAKDLADPNAWFSLEFAEALFDALVKRAEDPSIVDRAIKLALSRKHLGILYPLFRSFGTPAFLYGQLAKLLPRLNKVTLLRVDTLGPQHIRVLAQPQPGAPSERTTHFCTVRRVQLEEAARLFDLPAAVVAHPHCMSRGAQACIYDVQWSEHRRPIISQAGFLLGAALGAALIFVEGATLSMWIAAAALSVGGWALGRVSELRHGLGNRLADLSESHQALSRSTDAHEQRFAELLEAKTTVEKKVEERTAELSLATNQLSKMLTQVQELDRAKTNFFANVSHDLRTPLSLIIGPLGEMAAGREPPGGTKHAVDVMQRNGTRLLNLINQLLDLAKIDDGKMQIARNPTDVLELARTVEARFSAQADQKGFELSTVGTQLAPIALDSTWIETALTNLVGNAMRFAKSCVTLKVREEAGSVVLEVQDDGVGIAASDLAKVFDRFAQGSDSQARKGGTGLGLAIVREAARLHGGDASVRSQPGVATIFTLTLPRTMAANEAGTSIRPPAPPGDAASSASIASHAAITASGAPGAVAELQLEWPGPDPTAPLVVVVEDDDDLRGFTSEVLAAQYRVRATRNGEEGLAAVIELHPDAVVSDVVMPVMDGYELCKRLRARDDTRTLPVILLTARRDVGRVLEGFEAGADDYLTKPFQARELLARVSVHVRLRQVVSEMAHRERLASLGVLAASLAHQVRNPLNAILAGLPAVRRKLAKVMQERDDEVFGAMIYSAERINTLIADLMDLSRVDADSVSQFRPSVGVHACIRLIDARDPGSVQIETEIDEAIELEGKAGDMNHVFLNLIDNAVRAAGRDGRVKIRAVRRGDTFAFEVGDSGPGIPADKTEAVFAPFFTTRQAGEGTGLGLAIARQVVLQHAGTIAVGTSELGGALFTVTLPTTGVSSTLMPGSQAALTAYVAPPPGR